MATSGLHEVCRQRPQRSTFGGFFLVFVLYAFHCADRRSRCGRLCGILLCAAPALDESFLPRSRFYAMVPRHAHDLRDNRQAAKFCANLVERQPDFRASRHSRRFHVAVPAYLRSGRQINPAARFERLKRLHFELCVFLRAPGAQFLFKPHEKLCPWSNRVGYHRQPMPFHVRLLTLLVTPLCCRFSWRFLSLILCFACGAQAKRHRQNRDAGGYNANFLSFHGLLPRNAEQTRNAPGEPPSSFDMSCKGLKNMHLEVQPSAQKQTTRVLSANPVIGLQGVPDTRNHGIALSAAIFPGSAVSVGTLRHTWKGLRGQSVCSVG